MISDASICPCESSHKSLQSGTYCWAVLTDDASWNESRNARINPWAQLIFIFVRLCPTRRNRQVFLSRFLKSQPWCFYGVKEIAGITTTGAYDLASHQCFRRILQVDVQIQHFYSISKLVRWRRLDGMGSAHDVHGCFLYLSFIPCSEHRVPSKGANPFC